MTYRYLGRTGVQVSPLALGAMNFGAWANQDHDDAARIIHRALDAGINVVDTADVYSQGENEEIVGKALAGRRDDVFLASKFHAEVGGPNRSGNTRRWITRAVENSLRRLGTDHLDLYQVHRPDPDTDIDETLSALTDLVRHGKIRYFGTTTFEPHQLVEAQIAAERRNLQRPVTEQPPYSILARGAERATLPIAEKYGLGVLTWSPLAGGWLSGRYRPGEAEQAVSSRIERQAHRHDPALAANKIKRAAAEELVKLADDAGLSLVHLSLAFVLQHPAVSSVIIGPRTLEHLEGQLGAVDVKLSSDILDRIDEIVAPGLTISPADEGYLPPSLTDSSVRRFDRKN
ncbi:aldo/keto reductase [Rhodococcoides kyotonense]|uniref:Predicted oxidoreductase n=1 Tax=Rhodococcoides kyotonense TaxID=398843 RepID=A0A239GBE1_9NOCA|nr:aldo/keto reductase [Rhodococcus kyotonensis]SNS66430.1 Predicted oxidoreductase [Rhodococcus kyotonensis]